MHAIDSFFFKAGNPPPTFPIPTLHTMLEFPPRVVPIAHTILSPRSVARRNAIVRVAVLSNSRRSSSPAARAPGRSSSPAAHAPGRSSSPVACAPGRAYINRGRFSPGPVITIQRRPASTSGYDTDSDLTSISGVSPNLFMPDDAPAPAPVPGELMSKPKGEVGRPGRGGYTLEKAVDFNSRTFRAIRKRVHELCDEYLDTSKSIKFQNANRLREVRDEAKRHFPALGRYEGCWPVDDMVLLHLKNTSRRATLRSAAAKI